jgi:CTD nuclear envelope phosphatase 1
MNSLNILSARVSPPQTPTTSRSRSNSHANLLSVGGRRNSGDDGLEGKLEDDSDVPAIDIHGDGAIQEDTPLLSKEADSFAPAQSGWHKVPKRISTVVLESLQWVLSTLATPGIYLIACLYDEGGNFAPFSQLRKLAVPFASNGRQRSTSKVEVTAQEDSSRLRERNHEKRHSRRISVQGTRKVISNSSSSGLSSESESDRELFRVENESRASAAGRHARGDSMDPTEETAPTRRSIRIKLHNEDSMRQRKHRRGQSASTQSKDSSGNPTGDQPAASIKSPTSPSSSLSMTRYPRAPAAPRPLIPERQPSYVLPDPLSGRVPQKTLILDLDETLIHSMAKGGRMSTGHMVEVKLNTVVGAGGSATLGPQHPILYYVHKRPHCDDFLRKVGCHVAMTMIY